MILESQLIIFKPHKLMGKKRLKHLAYISYLPYQIEKREIFLYIRFPLIKEEGVIYQWSHAPIQPFIASILALPIKFIV